MLNLGLDVPKLPDFQKKDKAEVPIFIIGTLSARNFQPKLTDFPDFQMYQNFQP